jgi:hypothetical protein
LNSRAQTGTLLGTQACAGEILSRKTHPRSADSRAASRVKCVAGKSTSPAKIQLEFGGEANWPPAKCRATPLPDRRGHCRHRGRTRGRTQREWRRNPVATGAGTSAEEAELSGLWAGLASRRWGEGMGRLHRSPSLRRTSLSSATATTSCSTRRFEALPWSEPWL